MTDSLYLNSGFDNLDNISFVEGDVIDSIFDNQYHNYRFITEYSGDFAGPMIREVTFMSPGWNFLLLFLVMILMILNKSLTQQKITSAITMSLQIGNIERNLRNTSSMSGIFYVSVVISSAMLLSLLIQKIYIIFGNNTILHANFGFYTDVLVSVLAFFIINYLLITFFAWLFNEKNVILLHINHCLSNMEAINIIMIPIMIILCFYPYGFFANACVVMLLILYVIRLLKFFIDVRLLPRVGFVNIFLYLCTIEIIPILIIIKMVIAFL